MLNIFFKQKHIQFLLAFILVMLIAVNSFSQTKTSLLEKEISVSIANEKTDVALNRIAQKGGFSFSYNSSIVDVNKTVTVTAEKKSVREILNGIFKGKLIYKEKGNYIILSKAPLKLSDEKVKPELIIVSGYIVDEKTGNKIPAVTIYDKVSRTSVISDDYGYYSIKLNRKDPQIQLVVNKHNYNDTVLTLTAAKNQYVNVYIKPLYANNDSLLTDSFYVDENQLAILLADAEQRINTENVKDTLHSKFQFSVLPYLGTNMKMSGSVTNDYSFNLLGGYSMGTNYFEIGGLLNSNRANVSYAQLAGITNIVGGNVLGLQMAGVANIVKGTVTGAQWAGCVNVNDSDVFALQFAGLVNVNTGKTISGQAAGLVNYNVDSVTGVSVAGLGNNCLNNHVGVQVGGLYNYTQNTITGIQVAGLYNYARKVNGVQIGFLNVSDTCNGVPIGFLSFVKNGYHKIEFSADELFYTNIAFRTGTNYFHNLLQAGMRPDDMAKKTWYIGYGFGTTARLNNWLNFDFDLSANQISEGKILDHMSLLNKAYVGFEFQIAKKFSMALGATVNAYFTDLKYDDYPKLFTDFNPNIFYQENINNRYNVKMWVGGKVALRVL